MTDTLPTLATWPLNLIGWPIFTSTQEAFLYANLIHDDPNLQAHLVRYRQETYAELRREREKKDPDLQQMMDLAVTAQFYREAYMEAARINAELHQVGGG
ncbi:hypothetical protein ES702_06892 [subsurface metagenome]